MEKIQDTRNIAGTAVWKKYDIIIFKTKKMPYLGRQHYFFNILYKGEFRCASQLFNDIESALKEAHHIINNQYYYLIEEAKIRELTTREKYLVNKRIFGRR